MLESINSSEEHQEPAGITSTEHFSAFDDPLVKGLQEGAGIAFTWGGEIIKSGGPEVEAFGNGISAVPTLLFGIAKHIDQGSSPWEAGVDIGVDLALGAQPIPVQVALKVSQAANSVAELRPEYLARFEGIDKFEPQDASERFEEQRFIEGLAAPDRMIAGAKGALQHPKETLGKLNKELKEYPLEGLLGPVIPLVIEKLRRDIAKLPTVPSDTPRMSESSPSTTDTLMALLPQDSTSDSSVAPPPQHDSEPVDTGDHKHPMVHSMYHPPKESTSKEEIKVSPHIKVTSDGFQAGVQVTGNKFGPVDVGFRFTDMDNIISDLGNRWLGKYAGESTLGSVKTVINGEACTLLIQPTGGLWGRAFITDIKMVVRHDKTGTKSREVKFELPVSGLPTPWGGKGLSDERNKAAIQEGAEKAVASLIKKCPELSSRTYDCALIMLPHEDIPTSTEGAADMASEAPQETTEAHATATETESSRLEETQKVEEDAEELKQHRQREVARTQDHILGVKSAQLIADLIFDVAVPRLLSKEKQKSGADLIQSTRQAITHGLMLGEHLLTERLPVMAEASDASPGFFAEHQPDYLTARISFAGMQLAIELLIKIFGENKIFSGLKKVTQGATAVLDMYALASATCSLLSGVGLMPLLSLASRVPLLTPWLLDAPNKAAPEIVSTNPVRLFLGHFFENLNGSSINRYAVVHGGTMLSILIRFLSTETSSASTLLSIGKRCLSEIIAPLIFAYHAGQVIVSLPEISRLRRLGNILLARGIYIDLESALPENRKQLFFETWLLIKHQSGDLTISPPKEEEDSLLKAISFYTNEDVEALKELIKASAIREKNACITLERALHRAIVIIDEAHHVIYPAGPINDTDLLEDPIVVCCHPKDGYSTVLMHGEAYFEAANSKHLIKEQMDLAASDTTYRHHMQSRQQEIATIKSVPPLDDSFWDRQRRREQLCDVIEASLQSISTPAVRVDPREAGSEDNMNQAAMGLLSSESSTSQALLQDLSLWMKGHLQSEDIHQAPSY